MSKMDSEQLCRICLNSGAKYFIFDNEEFSFKLSLCLSQKIEDIKGYPKQICEMCNSTLEIIYSFIIKFQETCKVLQEKALYQIKVEAEDKSSLEITHFKAELDEFYDNEDDHQNKNIKLEEFPVIEKKQKKLTSKKEVKSRNSSFNKSIIKTIRSSILEAEFEWNADKWCLKSNQPAKITKVKCIAPIAKLPKVKKPPPEKLCDLCGQVFKTQDRLSAHKRRTHALAEPVKCAECSRSYVSNYYLHRHIQRRHNTVKNFVCSTCGHAFAFKGDLSTHHRSVHNKHLRPKKVYSCKFCDKTYKCAKSIIVHERSVHTGFRPAVCSECGTTFAHDDYLKEHMRLHTGETPFKCPICGRGYAQRCNMKSHLRIHRISELDAVTLSKMRPNYLKLLKQ